MLLFVCLSVHDPCASAPFYRGLEETLLLRFCTCPKEAWAAACISFCQLACRNNIKRGFASPPHVFSTCFPTCNKLTFKISKLASFTFSLHPHPYAAFQSICKDACILIKQSLTNLHHQNKLEEQYYSVKPLYLHLNIFPS